MEERRKNMDELFDKAKHAEVDYSLQKVASVIGVSVLAGSAVAASTGSIFKLSTMWITLGSIATAVSTVLVINSSQADENKNLVSELTQTEQIRLVEQESPKNQLIHIETLQIDTSVLPTDQLMEPNVLEPSLFDSNLIPDSIIFDPIVEEISLKPANSRLEPFKSIYLNAAVNVRLVKGENYAISYEGNKDQYDLLEINVENGNLKIGVKPNNNRQNMTRNYQNEDFELIVTMPSLEKIMLNGSGDIYSDDAIHSDVLTILLNGSGDVSLQKIVPKSLIVSVNGSGDVSLYSTGRIENGEILINGSGDVCTRSASINNLTVKIVGSGDASVQADQKLTIVLTGSGDVYYFGNATVSQSTLGSGEVRFCR